MSLILTRRRRVSPILTRPVLVGALLVGCLLLAGCRADVELALQVQADGSGELALRVAADEELLRRARAADVDPFEPVRDAARGLRAQGWRVRERPRAEGGREVVLSTGLQRPQELAGVTTELARALESPEVRPLEPFILDVSDDRLTVAGGAGLRLREAVQALGYTQAGARQKLEDHLSYRVSLQLPDAVLDSNAEEVRDGTLRWRVEPGERQLILAEGVRPSPVAAALVVVAAALGAAVALALVARSRARRQVPQAG